MSRCVLSALALLAAFGGRIAMAEEAKPDPRMVVTDFIRDCQAWSERAQAARQERKGLLGRPLQRKEWELADRANAEHEALIARYRQTNTAVGMLEDWTLHDATGETVTDSRVDGLTAVVTTRFPLPDYGFGFPTETINEYTLAWSGERWLLTGIARKGSQPRPPQKIGEDPRRMISIYQWDTLEPQLLGKDGSAALDVLLRMGHRCTLEPERDSVGTVDGKRPLYTLPPTISCLRQLTDKYGNHVMATVSLFLDLPQPPRTFDEVLARLPEGRVQHLFASQEAILDWPHHGRTVFRDDGLPELQEKFGKRKEVRDLEGRAAKGALESLLRQGFKCGYRDWKSRSEATPNAAIACSRPAPFELNHCFGFLYFDLAGPALPVDRPEGIFWSEAHTVHNITVRCGSFNSLSFDP